MIYFPFAKYHYENKINLRELGYGNQISDVGRSRETQGRAGGGDEGKELWQRLMTNSIKKRPNRYQRPYS